MMCDHDEVAVRILDENLAPSAFAVAVAARDFARADMQRPALDRERRLYGCEIVDRI